MRKKNLILSILTVLFANIVYFIWMPYPKSFLKTAGSSTFLFDLLTNLIYFAAFAMILIVSVNAVTRPGTILTKSKIPAAIAICIAMQLGFDFLKFAAERLLRWWAPLSNDFLTVLGLFVLVLVVRKLLKVKDINWKRFYAVFLPAAVIILAIFFVLDIQDILNVQHAADKYVFDLFDTELSHEMNAITANMQFLYELRNAILDFLTCSVIMIALYFSTVSENIKDNEEYHTKEAHFATRIAAILLLSFAVCGAKVLVLPFNAMNRMQFPSLSARGEGFNITQKETIVWRTNNSFNSKKKICHIMYCKLKYQDDYLYSFRIDGEYSPRKTYMEGNQIVLYEDRERTEVNGTEVIICYDKAFAYLKDGKPYVVTTESISEKEYDAILLGACERMLDEGRFEFFEYICEYIQKYDPVFIEPYLARYCIGDFSSTELQRMSNIDPDYITKCAKRFAHQ